MAAANVAVFLSADDSKLQSAFNRSTRTIQQFEKTFGSAASSLEAHKRRMDSAFQSLSGDNIIAEAHALSAALNRVGGAAKLTEAEQRRVNATVTEAIAKYKALGQAAPQSLIAIANATKQVGTLAPQATLAGKAMGVLSSTFAQFTAANLAATAIQNVVGRLSEFVVQGSKLPGLQASFEKLTGTVGQSSAAMLGAMQAGTRGLVSNLDLMQSANKAILLGLPVTTKEMGELAKTATVLGKAMGQDATSSLNDLITALGRSSPLILDNLGLTVKVGEANEAYAAKLGKTASQLTDAESKMAFYEAAMEAARRKTAEIGEQTKTLGEIVESAWVSIGNVVTATTATINVGIGKALSSGREFATFMQDVIRVGLAMATLNAQIREGLSQGGGGQKLTPEQVAFDKAFEQVAAFQALQREAKGLTEALTPLTNQQRTLALQFIQGGKSAQFIAEKLNSVAATAGVSERQIQPLVDAYKKSGKEGSAFADVMKKIQAASKPLSQSHQAQARELLKLGLSHREVAVALRVSEVQVQLFADAEKEAADKADALNKIIKQQIALLPRLKINFDAMNQAAGFTQNIPDVPRSGLMSPLVEALKRDFATIDFKTVDARAAIERVATGIQDAVDASPPTKWDKLVMLRADAFKGQMKAAGLDFVHNMSTAMADAIRTGDWSQMENALADAISTLMSEAMAAAVDFFVPGLGQALKPIFKAISEKFTDFLGLGTKGRDAVKDFADSFGGFDKLHAELLRMGDAGEALWKKLTQGVGRNNPEQAAAVIEEITNALGEFGTEAERAQRRLDALGRAVDGVNKRAELFAAPFEKMIAAQKAATERGDTAGADAIGRDLMAAAQSGQAAFERLGQFVGATFAGIVKETGDALGAIQQLAPAFAVIQRGVNEFGLTTNSTIDALLGMFSLINDAVTGPILQSIQATGQIFSGLTEAGYMTADLFQTVAADIGASFRDLEAKGGDVAKAMALSQPILQKLWEGQQIYGAVTDETTAALLKQAEEQGLVGAHMKDVNSKILEVLIAIADVFGAKIPEGMRATVTAGGQMATDLKNQARTAADDIEKTLGRIKVSPITIPVNFDIENTLPDEIRPLGFSHGTRGKFVDFGRGTLAVLHGRERVVTEAEGRREAASVRSSGGGGDVYVSSVYIDGASGDKEEMARQFWDTVRQDGKLRAKALTSLGIG